LELVSGKLEVFFVCGRTVGTTPDETKVDTDLLEVHTAQLFDLIGDATFRIEVLASRDVLL
jgi:hypothetical protein